MRRVLGLFVSLSLAIGWFGSPAAAQTTDLVTYLGGLGNQRLHSALQLSDGTFVISGGTTSLAWVPAGVPVTELAAPGLQSAADDQIGFIVHLSGDLQTVLRVVHLPVGTAADILHLRSTEIPGQTTGLLFISGNRSNSTDPARTIADYSDGYFIARLDQNFVTAPPTSLVYVVNVAAGSLYKTTQPWDVQNDGRVWFTSGTSNSGTTTFLARLSPTGEREIVPLFRNHVLQDGSNFTGLASEYNNPANPIVSSRLLLMQTGSGGLRSRTWEEFDALTDDGNGGIRKGSQPNDLYGLGPNSAGGKGYSGLSHTSSSYGIGQIAVDRRDNHLYIPGNVQTDHAGGLPDFEPHFIALRDDGTLKWWNRLWREMVVTDGILRTTNSTSNFSVANTGLGNRHVRAFAWHPTNTSVVYAGSYGGVFKSTDAGQTWAAANTGLTAPRILALAVPASATSRVYAATNQGFFRSDDEGGTWVAANAGLTDLYLTCLAVHPTDANIVFAGTGGSGLWRTLDGGTTWAEVTTGLVDNNRWVNAIVLDPLAPATAVLGAAGGDGLLRSTNATAADAASVAWVASNAVAAGSAAPPGDWRNTVFSLAIRRPALGSPAQVWAGTGNGVYRSDDGGQTWWRAWGSNISLGGSTTTRRFAHVRSIAVNPTNPSEIVVGTGYLGVFRTTDAGVTWAAQRNGFAGRPSNTAISFGDMTYAVAMQPGTPATVLVGTMGHPNNSIPDQYGDAAAIDYSVSGTEAQVGVVARSHGSDFANLWGGNTISLANNPSHPGTSYHNNFTGTNGNIHTCWIGRFRARDGALMYASRLAEFVFASDQTVGAPYTDPNLDGWPNKSSGNADLNTTQNDRRTAVFDSQGRLYVIATGRLVHTTRNAYQKVPNRYRKGTLTAVTSTTELQATSLIGNEMIAPGFATFVITTSGSNQNVFRTITAFNPVSGKLTLDEPLPALPAVGNAFTIVEGGSNWSDFVRVYSPDFTTLAFSSVLTGNFDRFTTGSAAGADNTTLRGVIPVSGGLLTVGYQRTDAGVPRGYPIPVRMVPTWGRATPEAEEGIVGRLSFTRPPAIYVEPTTPETFDGNGAPPAIFTLTRLADDLSQPLTIGYDITGSALNAVDYAALSGTATFAAGSGTTTIAVQPIPDGVATGDKEVELTLRDTSTAYRAGSLKQAKVRIIDSNGPGQAVVAAAEYTVDEQAAGNSIAVTIRRVHGRAGAVSVNYGTVPGTAAAGVNFTATTGTLHWADGDTTDRTVVIPILNDGADTATLSFQLTLSAPTGGLALGLLPTATIRLTDYFVPGTIQFLDAAVTSAAQSGVANLLVTRTGGNTGAQSVVVRTFAETATAGVNFVATEHILSWEHGDSGTRLLSIPLLVEATQSGPLTFLVSLNPPVGGAALGTHGFSRVTVTNAQSPGALQLSLANYVGLLTPGSTVPVAVRRLGGTAGAASVTLTTTNGTATAGTHFTALNETLTWADGEAGVRTVALPILGAAGATNSVALTVSLTGATGASLGSPATAKVTLSLPTGTAELVWNNTSGDRNWNTTAANWTGAATTFATDSAVAFTSTAKTGTSNYIEIAAGGVSPSAVRLAPGGTRTSDTGYQFRGGVISTGQVLKQSLERVRFGGGSAKFYYASSFPFAGGTRIEAGEIEFYAQTGTTLAAVTGTTLSFGTGPITLAGGGRFFYRGNVGAFTNDFIVESTGGTLAFNANASNIPVNFTGTFLVEGDLQLAATSGGNLGGFGHLLSGPMYLTGERLLTRMENTGNTNLSFAGPIRDGASPGRPSLANISGRTVYVTGGQNTYSGGTVIRSNGKAFNTSVLGDPAQHGTNNAIVVEPGANLGTGDVTVRSGGYLYLRGSTNLAAAAALIVETGGAVGLDAGATITVGALQLGDTLFTSGVFNRTTSPGFLYGQGTILVVPPVVVATASGAEIDPASSNVAERSGSFTITRLGSTAFPLVVPFTLGGSAVNGVHYATVPLTATIPIGQASVTVPVDGLNVPGAGARIVQLALTAQGAFRLGATTTARLVIREGNGAGLVRLTQAEVTQASPSTLTLTVERLGGTAGAVAVDWAASAGTALAGQDFTASSGTVSWLAGEAGTKTLTVPLLANPAASGSRQFTVGLSSPTGGIVLDNPAAAAITILHSDNITYTWNNTGTTNRTWDTTTANWTGLLPIYRDGGTARFTSTGAGAVTLSATVRPAATVFDTSSNYAITGGGLIAQGTFAKAGSGTVSFGSTSNSWANPPTFAGGTTVTGGILEVFSSYSAARFFWGTGPITLDNNAAFRSYLNAPASETDVNQFGALGNDLVIGPGGGRLIFKQFSSSRPWVHTGRIDLYGLLSWQGIGGGNQGSAGPNRLAGPIYLHGNQTIQFADRHNNHDNAITGVIQDGSLGAARLTLRNTVGRWLELGAVNTYTGGTVIDVASTSLNPLDSTTYANDVFAWRLRPTARLGLGPVLVKTDGFIRFRGNGNLHPASSLEIQPGALVTIDNGVNLTARLLILDNEVLTEGTYGSGNRPNYFLPNGTGTVTVVYVPEAPSGLTAMAGAAPTPFVDLAWTDNALVASSFALERRNVTASGTWEALTTVAANTTAYRDATVAAGTTYEYRVRATNANGQSDWSALATATTGDVGAPLPPANLTAQGVAVDAIQLLWTQPAGGAAATGHTIERRATGSLTWEGRGTASGTATGYLDTGLLSGSSFDYRVRATNASGASAWTAVASASTPAALSPYQVWASRVFTTAQLADSGTSGPLADPGKRGIGNLLAYALGTTPGGFPGEPPLRLSPRGDGLLNVVLRRRIGATSLTFRLDSSTDLATWDTSGTALVEEGAPVPTGDGVTEDVTYRTQVPTASLGRVFLRLTVSLNP